MFVWIIVYSSLFAVPTSQQDHHQCNPPIVRQKTTKITKTTKTLNLAPMLFHVQGNRVKSIEQLNLKELYRAASSSYQAKKYTLAIHLYKRILQYFPINRFKYVLYPHPGERFCVMTNSKQKYNQLKKLYS